MWSRTENCNPHNWTPNHFVVCFPISSTESNEINEPAYKKSKICADLDNTPEIPMDSQNEKTDIQPGDNEFSKSTKYDDAKSCGDYSHFSDLGEIVTGSINLNTMSSAERINFIQNQPSPDDVANIQTGLAQTKRTCEHKKTLNFLSSWVNQFTWLSFSKL